MNTNVGDSTAAQDSTANTLAISLLAFTMFVIVTSEFTVVGLLPVMATDLNVGLSGAGWFISCFALGASLLGPPVTMLVARYQSVKFLVAGSVFFAAGNLLIAITPSFYTVIVTRVLQGALLPAMISIAALEATRLAGVGREGWAISRVNLGVAATTIVGVPLSTFVADKLGWSMSFAGLALLGLICAVAIALWFVDEGGAGTKQSSRLPAVSLLWQPRFLLQLLLSSVLFASMFSGYSYIAALLAAATNINGPMLGWALMGFGIAGVLGNWLCGQVAERDPLALTAWVSLALAIAMAAFSSAASSLIGLILVLGLWGCAHLAAFVVSQIRVMQAGRGAPAFALALNISACNLGIGIGATIGGMSVDSYGVEAASYTGSVLATVAFLIAVLMIRYGSAIRRLE
ncbi:MAG: MFS transporter [Pseudomonadales bacterium]|nr:MFS transporter [Pseudomonadales bacterium]NRA16117.1 MFS transporter [Oceanospirillaceae bacterium]